MNIQELESLFYVCFERALNTPSFAVVNDAGRQCELSTPTIRAVLNDVDNAMKYDVRGNDCAGKP